MNPSNFYKALSKKLVSLFQKKYGPDNASDAVHDSFKRYIEDGKDLEFENAFAWLYTTAKNKLLDIARKERRFRNKKQEMKQFSENFDDPTKRLHEYDREVMRRYLETAIEKLSPRSSDVMKGAMAGKSNKEIAETLNMSISTVKSHKSRSMATLKKTLKVDAAFFHKFFKG
jgi:RNA polymerase sigma factor (sigma-70 family)